LPVQPRTTRRDVSRVIYRELSASSEAEKTETLFGVLWPGARLPGPISDRNSFVSALLGRKEVEGVKPRRPRGGPTGAPSPTGTSVITDRMREMHWSWPSGHNQIASDSSAPNS
jgi:hypothetical protein